MAADLFLLLHQLQDSQATAGRQRRTNIHTVLLRDSLRKVVVQLYRNRNDTVVFDDNLEF